MEKKSDTFQIAADIQWEFAGEGIVRQIMAYDEHLMMVKVRFSQGAIGTLHQHPHTQSTYIASGCFEVTIGEEKKVLRAGDMWLPTFCMVVSVWRQVFSSTPSLPCARIS
jgi:quercetin dioxygenase-like cupin family protein